MTADDEYHRWLAKWLRQALADAAENHPEDLRGGEEDAFSHRSGAGEWMSDPLALKIVGVWILLVMDANFSSAEDESYPLAAVKEAIRQAKAGDADAARRGLVEALQAIDS
jgi:hypothetical protein